MKYSTAIFDMDGTILDTLTDLQNGVNHALALNNMPIHTYDEIRLFVGNGIRKLIERSVPAGTSEELIQKVHKDFTDFYKIHSADHTCPYNGITQVIKTLKESGIKTAVVSNKPDYGVQDLVKEFFDGLFDASIGQLDNIPTKPAPDMVNKALSILNSSPKESVYIGDSDVDFQTALNSKMDFIGCDWGFRGRDFLEKLGTKVIADQPQALISLILGK